MALCGKLEVDVEVNCPAHKLHEVFCRRPHHICHMAPKHIKSCEIHEGEWGKEGFIVFWNYIHDGVAKVAKEIIEAIDDVKLCTTFKVIEGEIMNEFKSYKATVQAIPKGEGCVAHWSFEYEKLNEYVADPHSYLQFSVDLTKDIACHLTKA